MITIMMLFEFVMCVSAQSDGFFSYQYEHRRDRDDEWAEILLLPNAHGLNYNVPAETPIGSGLLILVGMGFSYGIIKKRNNDHKR